MCPTLCLGRKGQTLDPLEPAVTDLSRLLDSHRCMQSLAQKESLKSSVKPLLSLTSCIPAIKASSVVAWVNRGCLQCLRRRAQLLLSIPLIFQTVPQVPMYCVSGTCPHLLWTGFEWALSPVVLSFKFTFNTFSAPLDL